MTQAVWRLSGWAVRTAIGVAALLTAQPPNRLASQVGHNPATSPYRDIALHPGPIVFVGHLGADRGTAGVGTSNALTFGTRYELPAGRVMQFQFTGAYLRGDRFLVNPYADSNSASRRSGPVKSDLLQLEIGMQLRLTGGKTWRGLAPFVGTGLGLISELNAAADTSGYRFGTKFTIAFVSGVRWYPARRVSVTGDLRALFWRLKYPVAFHTPLAPDGSRVLPLTARLTDWTTHSWISLGIGWTF